MRQIQKIVDIKIRYNIPQNICDICNFSDQGRNRIAQINQKAVNNFRGVAQINMNIAKIDIRITKIHMNNVAAAITIITICAIGTVLTIFSGLYIR